MARIVISGSGIFTPPLSISNEELVNTFNIWVNKYNEKHKVQIEAGTCEPLQESSAPFIEKASGIKSRYVLDREGILDPEIMCPRFPKRSRDEMSLQCEISVKAAKDAMKSSEKKPEDIDAVIVACSTYERAYPAIAIEVQTALGINGFAFDMNVACSSATFAIQTAVDSIFRGNARAVLLLNPEISTGHLNFRDRDSHFIFGDVCTALIVEKEDHCTKKESFEIIDTKLMTRYSTNIYNSFGALDRTRPDDNDEKNKLFSQQGRKVFKEVVPLASEFIRSHLADNDITPTQLKRVWLHQANKNMNQLICKKLLGSDVPPETTPMVLDKYANTAGAGSIVSFHKHHANMAVQDLGVICSFGAGYSVGNVIVRRIDL